MKRVTPLDDPESNDDGGPLFSVTHARRSDPETSKESAARAESLAGEHCRMIAQALSEMPHGGTCDEVADVIRVLNRHQVGRRMSDLVKDRIVVDSGNRRPTPSGRKAIVWLIASDRPC